MRDDVELTPNQILGLGHESLARRRNSFVRLFLGVCELWACGGATVRGGGRNVAVVRR